MYAEVASTGSGGAVGAGLLCSLSHLCWRLPSAQAGPAGVALALLLLAACCPAKCDSKRLPWALPAQGTHLHGSSWWGSFPSLPHNLPRWQIAGSRDLGLSTWASPAQGPGSQVHCEGGNPGVPGTLPVLGASGAVTSAPFPVFGAHRKLVAKLLTP